MQSPTCIQPRAHRHYRQLSSYLVPRRKSATILTGNILRAPLWLLSLVSMVIVSGCAGFDLSQGPQLKLHEVHPFGARRLAFNPSGSRLASGGLNGEVKIWSLPSGDLLAVLPGSNDAISGLLWPDEDHILCSDEQGRILLWNIPSRSVKAANRSGDITGIAILPEPQRLITGDSSGRVQSFSFPGFERLAATELDSEVLSVATEPGRQWVAVATADRGVLLLDGQLRPVQTIQSPPGRIFELRFSPDGRQLAGGSWFRIFLWTLPSGELQVRDTEHTGAIVSLDYSPDGRQMVSIGRITDSRILVTDAASGMVNRRLTPQPLCGWNVRFSPDGRHIAGASEDGSVHLYDLTIPYEPTWYHD